MTSWVFSLAFTISQLTHPIFTPWSAFLQWQPAKCQKQGKFRLLCIAPPVLHRMTACPILLLCLPKITQRAFACSGIRDERKWRKGWKEGREGDWLFFSLLSVGFSRLHNIGEKKSERCPVISFLVWKMDLFIKFDTAIRLGTAIYDFTWLNRERCLS